MVGTHASSLSFMRDSSLVQNHHLLSARPSKFFTGWLFLKPQHPVQKIESGSMNTQGGNLLGGVFKHKQTTMHLCVHICMHTDVLADLFLPPQNIPHFSAIDLKGLHIHFCDKKTLHKQ